MQHQSSGHEDAEGHGGLNGASSAGRFWGLATKQPFALKSWFGGRANTKCHMEIKK